MRKGKCCVHRSERGVLGDPQVIAALLCRAYTLSEVGHNFEIKGSLSTNGMRDKVQQQHRCKLPHADLSMRQEPPRALHDPYIRDGGT